MHCSAQIADVQRSGGDVEDAVGAQDQRGQYVIVDIGEPISLGPVDALQAGDFSVRIPVRRKDQIGELQRSFNQMAAELEESERQRRDIIANTAHELRTPLTNLEGYLEAIRDGVIQPDSSTYESLLEETERLVRLARSLDDLAIGACTRRTDGALAVRAL